MYYRFFLFINLLCFGSVLVANAQQIPYKKYTTIDGLVQNQALNIMQDSKGYIWVGTKGGVSKFDGEEFENFTTKDGLPHSYVEYITEDLNGNIWIVTKKGITKYNGKELQNFLHEGVKKIYVDSLERIWFRNIDLDLIRLDIRSDTEENLSEKCALICEENIEVGSIYYDTKNRQTIVTARDDFRALKAFILKGEEIFEVNLNKVTAIWQNTDGRILGRNEDYSYFFELIGYDFALLRSLKSPIQLSGGYIIDNNKNLYIKSREEDKIDGKWNQIYKIDSLGTKVPIPVEIPVIAKLLLDKEQNLWAATEKGIVKIMNEHFIHYNKDDGLNYIWSIVEGINGNMYFASYGDGLSKQIGDTMIVSLEDKYKSYFGGNAFYMGAIKSKKGSLLFPASTLLLTYENDTFDVYPDTDRVHRRKREGKDIGAILDIYEDTTENLLF